MIFGYCRVSSEEQALHGISVSAQRDILNGYAAMSQSAIRIYEDPGFSGKNMQRPALRRLLADLQQEPVDAVVVWKLDRLSRSLRDTLAIIEDILQPRHIRLVSITESIDTSSPSGRMMLNMLASFAQLEREQDSDRVVMAHKHLARDCRYLGGHIPLGYAVNSSGYFELDPPTALIVRQVFEMYLSHYGYTEILSFLNSHVDSFGKRKRPFGKADLKYLLHNEFYSGTYIRRMGADKRSKISSPEVIRVPGGVPAIISQEEWRRVQVIRDENKQNHTSAMYRARQVYPLSGLVYCAVCGKPMSLNYGGKDRDGTVQRYYVCRNKCVRPSRLEFTEQAVFEAVDHLLENEDALIHACEIANSYSASADEDHQDEILVLQERKQEIAKQNARLLAFIKEHGTAAPASMMDELKSLEHETQDIDARILAFRRATCVYDSAETLSALRAVQSAKKLPPEKQKPVLQAAIRRVLVSADEIQVQPNWHSCGGDDPPHPICQSVPRR